MKTVQTAMLFFAVFLSTGAARADHIPWMDKYGCCGEKNCLPASVMKKSESGDVVINGIPVPMDSRRVHRSETAYGWYCWKIIDGCAPPKGSETVPPEIITKECALCAFYEERAGNF